MDFNENRHSPDGGLWLRTTSALSGGGIFRTILRLIALFGALIVLGLNKIQCSLNYLGANNLATQSKFMLFYESAKYGYERASLLLWHQLSSITTSTFHNWGDSFILILFVGFIFFALYSMISIIADFFDGSPTDKSPMYLKLMITVAGILVFSAIIFYSADKPQGDYIVNTNLILTPQESQICSQTGKVGFFITLDSLKTSLVNQNITNMNDTINNSNINNSNVVNDTINNSNINNSNSSNDNSIQLINMLNN